MSLDKSEILVSIIINNYNYGHFLQEAIDSALNQTYPNIEVVVVDDGSTDNSREIIASYKERIIPVLKENGGQASAFKAGFTASKGDIICFLDADDIFPPNKVSKIVDVFGYSEDIGWCFHRVMRFDTKTGESLGLIPNETTSRECDFRADLKSGKFSLKTPPTSGLCFRRSLLQLIVPFVEVIAPICADQQLRFAALALSKGFFLAEQLAFLRIHDHNAYSFRANKKHLQMRARLNTLTAHWMWVNFPDLTKFTNKLFAQGVGTYWRTGGIEKEYTELIKNYLSGVSQMEKFEIRLRAFYYYIKGEPQVRGYRK